MSISFEFDISCTIELRGDVLFDGKRHLPSVALEASPERGVGSFGEVVLCMRSRDRSAIDATVIVVPTSPWFHYLGDFAAWVMAFLGARWVYRHRQKSVETFAHQTAPSYFLCLALGAATGAWLLGSINSLRDARPVISHSIAGALFGAIVAVELWKLVKGVRASTGGVFVIPLCLGVIVGRWGCLFAGLCSPLGSQSWRWRAATPGRDL
jgi:hypothetical protein